MQSNCISHHASKADWIDPGVVHQLCFTAEMTSLVRQIISMTL